MLTMMKFSHLISFSLISNMVFPIMVNTTASDSFFLVKNLLLVLSAYLMMIINNSKKNFNNNHLFMIMVLCLNLCLLLIFKFNELILFFSLFEISMILVMLMILIWGYQPERMKASLMMFFYTFISSLPMFSIFMKLITMNNSSYLMMLEYNFLLMNNLNSVFLFTAFLVKLPVFGVHNWLPEAHVEAPVFGSMVLAGIMLKLGALGLIIFSQIIVSSQFLVLFSLISLLGGVILSKMMIRLSDVKVIIAYSSVVHMSMIPLNSFSNSELGIKGVIWMSVAHGLTSACMFSMLDFLYNNSHSRSLFINKAVSKYSSVMMILWLLINMINFGGPMTVNLMSELYLITSMSLISSINLILGGVTTLLSLIYAIIIYSSIMQGVNSLFYSKFNQPSFTCFSIWSMMMWPTPLLMFSTQL